MPFVSVDSGLSISENYVSPLYKNCINAKHPTMAVLGYVLQSAFSQILDVQVESKIKSNFRIDVTIKHFQFQIRFVMHYWNGDGILPSESEMLADVQRCINRRLSLNIPKRKGNTVGGILQREYFDDLTSTANIENYYGIYMDIYDDCAKRRNIDRRTYRNDVYKIIDKHRYERKTLGSESSV